jgi:hypothetical protein
VYVNLTFKIQVPSDVIRNPEISHESFLVYCKLIQHYYIRKDKNLTLQIDHKKFMYFCNIKANQTFKKCVNQLHKYGLVDNEIDKLPRNGLIEVELNSKYISNNKDFTFAQLPYYLLDKCIIDSIGVEGFRLLYYFKSYINNANEFCFCSRERISSEIGSNPKTVDKYTDILKKNKFIKVTKHKLGSTGEYENEFGIEKEKFTKFNNHYFIQTDKFEEIHNKIKNNST